MALFITVLSGTSVSTTAVLERSDRALTVFIPSMAPNAVRLQFATSSGAASAAFATYTTLNTTSGTANMYDLVSSSATRPAVFVLGRPVTPFMRVQLGAVTTDTATFTILPTL